MKQAKRRTLDVFMKTIPAVLFFIFASVAAADPATFHEHVTALYSFSPHALDQAGIDAKSKDLDAFWSSVKASGPSGIGNLRSELARSDASPFLSYDGAKLLLSLSNAKEDRALVLTSILRADLRDVDSTDYFLTVHEFAVEGLDTSEAAFKILSDPKFEAFIPQHSLTLDQEVCLTYLLLPTKEEFYLEKAEKLLFTEKDVTAQKSLLSLIADTATKFGDEVLARFADSSDQAEASRKYAREILEAIKKMELSTGGRKSTGSYDSLKTKQRELFARVSDEALDEWNELRVEIRRASRK
jgi:hypothetical protein